MISVETAPHWLEENQRFLSAAMAAVGVELDDHAQRRSRPEGAPSAMESSREMAWRDVELVRGLMTAPPAIESLCSIFGLSVFERSILLLSAAVELDGKFAARCAAANGDGARAYPTFGLALAALPDPHWTALTPSGPLRQWHLIEIGTGPGLTTSPLRIDERVLHFLAGVNQLDERLVGLTEVLPVASTLAPSQRETVRLVAAQWDVRPEGRWQVVALCGGERFDRRMIAAAAAEEVGLNVQAMSAGAIPTGTTEADALLRLWEREAALSGCVLLLECDDLETSDGPRHLAVRRWIERARGPLLVSARELRGDVQRPVVSFEVHKPTSIEQRALWAEELGGDAAALDGRLDHMISQFNLGPVKIRAAARSSLAEGAHAADRTEKIAQALWHACRSQSRPGLDELAQRISSDAAWDDLVLPERSLQVLREIALQLRQRARVYETWGFGSRSSRGLGLSALFSGPSGTGKTLAAEVLAGELQLDLYRVDLSQVVSKYIGETEKNLRRVFDAAEEGGAVLLFDEADALFGKRSEVKDSHDRYANIEVSYLLQRMEAYRGLAILTTNLKDALDTAFLRRIRFVVPFGFPDAALRAEIWRRIFPAQTPTAGLDPAKLARLNVAGGNIRNIALNAAFLAADAGQPVGMPHVARAARGEYAKLEKPLTAGELDGIS